MTIEIAHYGFVLDTKYCYVALSWELLIVSAAAYVGYRLLRKSQKKI